MSLFTVNTSPTPTRAPLGRIVRFAAAFHSAVAATLRPARSNESHGATSNHGIAPPKFRRVGQRSAVRRGAASVEFAIVAPIFVVITLGVAEAGRLFEVQNQLALAARHGARLAAMDRQNLLKSGETTNSKIADDVREFLRANGLPADDVRISIVDPDDHTTTINLDDPANDYELFEIRLELPCATVIGLGGSRTQNLTMTASLVFRNAEAPVDV